MLEIAFWSCVLLMFYAYPGYPILLWVLTKIRGSAQVAPRSDGNGETGSSSLPSLSAILVVRNESERLPTRLANLLSTPYEALREVIVVCDGCTDDSAETARRIPDSRVKVLELPSPRGKAAGLNAGAAAATGEALIFCDARQRFAADAISRLAEWFRDPGNGAVSGALEIESSSSGVGRGVDAYWRLEKLIRRMESDLDSAVGCTGAIYALRKGLFQPLPEDTILDDVVIPMQAAAQGGRVRFDAEAIAWDPQTLSGEKESRRKVRTLTGNFQMLARHPRWVLPWGHRLWWQLISHKYLRLCGPLLLLAMLVLSWLLRQHLLYAVAFGSLSLLLVLGVAARIAPSVKHPLVTVPGGFMFLQWCVLRAGWQWLFPARQGVWK